ncbi:radical SAM protein [Myxococcota bacterium]|nr:radical SAM protein [Myxococcota bacterium]MBU1534177.1 radical SAM protein [Myxococcota bacterium]
MDTKKQAEHSISAVEWALTAQCDLACAHCCANYPKALALTREEHLTIAGRLVGAGVGSVTLSGGEPLLVPHWHEIAAVLHGAGVSVQIITNGQHLTEPNLERFAELPLDFLWISLDGLENTHDGIRGKKGAFAAVMEGARVLERRGIPFGFITTVLRANITELPDLATVARESGARALWAHLGVPTSRSTLFLGVADREAVSRAVFKAAALFDGFYIGDNLGYGAQWDNLRHPLDEAGESNTVFRGCRAGIDLAGITPAGDVTPCLAMGRMPGAGNLLQRDLGDMDWGAALPAGGSDSCGECAGSDCFGGCRAMVKASAELGLSPLCLEAREKKSRLLTAALSLTAVAVSVQCSGGSGSTASGGTEMQPTVKKGNAPEAAPMLPMSPEKSGPMEPGTVQGGNRPPPLPMDAMKKPARTTPEVGSMNSVMNRFNPSHMPSCCFSHMLVPGCKCGMPRVPSPPRNP